jgi:hypothetical protein
MFIRTLLFAAVFLIFAQPARPCEYVPVSFDDQVKAAEKIFIGTVEKIQDKTATFKVDQGIKNAFANESFKVEMVLNTCGISFEAGQQWLYMGNTAMSGSMLLRQADGHVLEQNAALVKEKFGPPPAAQYDQERNILIID